MNRNPMRLIEKRKKKLEFIINKRKWSGHLVREMVVGEKGVNMNRSYTLNNLSIPIIPQSLIVKP